VETERKKRPRFDVGVAGYMELMKSNVLVDEWLRALSPACRKPYLRTIAYFVKETDIEPRQLLEMARGEPGRLKETFDRFYHHLRDRGLAPLTAARYVRNLRSFLLYHKAVPPRRIARLSMQRPPETPDWIRLSTLRVKDPETLKLLQCQPVEKWLRNFADSPPTLSLYLYYIKKFVDWSGMQPDEFLELARGDTPKAYGMMKDFYHENLTRVASKTALNMFVTVRSFLVWNDVRLPKMPRKFKAYREHEPGYSLTQEDVAKMVDAATSARNKAIIMFLAQSGQRVEVLTGLRYGHVKHDLEAGNVPIIVEVSEVLLDFAGRNVNKIRHWYSFMLGSDAAYFLRLMVEQRREWGEPIDEDSWLFRSYASRLSGGRLAPKKLAKDEPGPPLTTQGVREVVHTAASYAGVQKRGHGKIYRIHPHTFRAYFNTQLKLAGVDRIDRKFLMAQRLPYEGAYDRYSHEYLRRLWIAKRLDYYLGLTRPSPTREVLDLVILAREMGLDPDELIARASQRLKEVGGARRLEEQVRIEMLEELRKRATYSGGRPARARQRIVSEVELEGLLAEGWEVVAVLPSGRVVIRL